MADVKKILVPDLSQIELRSRTQDDSGSWWSDRGRVEFNGLATRRIGKVGLQQGLTARPAKLLVVPDPDKQNLFVVPVTDHPLAVDATYTRSKCTINLAPLFAFLGHTTMAGTREFHPVTFSPDPVEVNGTALPALVMPMKSTETKWKKSNKKASKESEAAKEQAAPAKA